MRVAIISAALLGALGLTVAGCAPTDNGSSGSTSGMQDQGNNQSNSAYHPMTDDNGQYQNIKHNDGTGSAGQ